MVKISVVGSWWGFSYAVLQRGRLHLRTVEESDVQGWPRWVLLVTILWVAIVGDEGLWSCAEDWYCNNLLNLKEWKTGLFWGGLKNKPTISFFLKLRLPNIAAKTPSGSLYWISDCDQRRRLFAMNGWLLTEFLDNWYPVIIHNSWDLTFLFCLQGPPDPVFTFTTFIIRFCLIVISFLCTLFADVSPRYQYSHASKDTSEQEVGKPCPKLTAAFLSVIFFWWFTP